MTSVAQQPDLRNLPVDRHESHCGDLRKLAFLHRLLAYRARREQQRSQLATLDQPA
jgi:hypothetical protein